MIIINLILLLFPCTNTSVVTNATSKANDTNTSINVTTTSSFDASDIFMYV